MIFLMTGVPGASKTLNTIKFINEDDQFKNRPVYYHNIKQFQRTNEKGELVIRSDWQELDDDSALKWYELPKGSVIVFDECQDLFPVITKRNGMPPESLSKFAKHRHAGIDVVLITQEPRNIDAFVRRLVGHHRHFERIFQTERLKVYKWDGKCCENVHDWHSRQEGAPSQSKIDHKYYGTYNSAEVHTHKARLPWGKIALIVIPLLAVPVLAWVAWSTFSGDDLQSKSDSSPSLQSSIFSPSDSGKLSKRSETLSTDDWFSMHSPRIEGLPFTAPIYDSVREPKTYPIPQCVYWAGKDECRCYSQQSTRMNVPENICRDLVSNGFFDYARVPDKDQDRQRQMQRQRSPAALSMSDHSLVAFDKPVSRQAFLLSEPEPHKIRTDRPTRSSRTVNVPVGDFRKGVPPSQ